MLDLKGKLISYADDTVIIEKGGHWNEVKSNGKNYGMVERKKSKTKYDESKFNSI